MAFTVRVLCLGNELLADDAFGNAVAEQLRLLFPASLDVVETPVSGFALIDYLPNVSCLLVVDTVQTGKAAPGTIHLVREGDIKSVSGCSPHYVGLFETLELARKLLPSVPQEVIILAVEAADCTTLGGAMHPAVQAAVPVALDLVREITQRCAPVHSGREPQPSEAVRVSIEAVVARFGRERFVVI